MTRPETTILIPTYNCGKFLLECLGSVLRQKYENYEILIIDDGSTDDTEGIIRNLNLPKLRYYRSNKNSGIVEALNKGLELAEGKYIARMDADDLMLGNRLQEQVNFLNSNSDFGLVGGNYQIIDNDGVLKDKVYTNFDPQFLRLGLIFRNQFHHSAVTMRTSLVKELKYSSKYPFCEDHELWIRFSEVTRIMNLPRFYLSYRWHDDNSCRKHQSLLKANVVSLLSRELDKNNIEHSIEELMLHSSVCFGVFNIFKKYGRKGYDILNWYDKVFGSDIIIANYDAVWLSKFKSHLLKDYCGIEV